ncbi:DUF397 domain-containing protein [Streptomyces sp. OK228]|uniref:DUF397 domain-containing protein n=1 Tax=Streptomyces sp. OK228 TaxID=1882786 RepID=UPI000BC74701|nr:DUF397 domain-containing protein [Streptomyces sp. OK228]SOE25594.1 protein of unknown function [Streptomyces sp. OK228]
MNWHKSTYSTGQNNCVEVADDVRVMVRDTKDHSAGMVTVSPSAWSEFIEHIA